MSNETNFGTGLIKETFPHMRNHDYEVVCGSVSAGATHPEEYEIPRENTGTLKNQGMVGACVAEVISQVAENWYTKQGEPGEMSEGFIYGALRNKNTTGPGMVVSTALELWKTIGTLPKKYFDELVEMPEIKKLVTKFPDFYDIASKYKLKAFVSLNYADRNKRDNAIKDALTKYQYGLVAASNEYFREPHCIQITGWNDKKNKYKFKNSWGATYGDNGFSEIPKDEINQIYLPIFEEIKEPFTDVVETDWFYDVVKKMYFSGLMKGTSDTTFEPNKPLTRAEAATILYRIIKEIDTRFDILNTWLNNSNAKLIFNQD